MTRIATLLAGAALFVPTVAAAADEFAIDTTHTHVLFFVDHFGMSTIQGEFLDVSGTFMLDRDAPANSSIAVTISAESLDSGVDARDEHFRSADFFDTATFPEVTFTSTSVEVTGEDTAVVTGDLTIRDVTQTVALDVTLNGLQDDHPFIDGEQPWAGFTATTTLQRSEWGLGLYAPMVPEAVEVRIEMEAVGSGA